MAFVETRYKFFLFGKSQLACVYRIADLASYEYEEESVKNSEGKVEKKEFCRLVFRNTSGLYNFRFKISNSLEFKSLEKYFDSLFGIQKTLGNTFKNAKRQMDAIKSFAAAAKAAADGTLDEEQAASTIGALDASVYGDRTEWIKKADEALAAFQ